ncbi:peptide/nickel transport system permease protein [Streptacidiphilus jiangxiensis]|uniref:Peptide/nickel transport system permease protein n=2 Tax=Streptacidiphilus jiangxiensis TaxID=235985 RepID=A0A1H7YKR9_STRJI|nr:peptide/nickel transport system permease protein [Streptacidiphilus jiangxiensis]
MAEAMTTTAAPPKPVQEKAPEHRSPARLAWRRFRRDRTGVFAGIVVALFFVAGLGAPLIAKLYGKDPYTTYGQNQSGLLDDFGYPTGRFGGMSSQFWLGVEPELGRDVFTQLLYGIRTSLLIALAIVLLITMAGTLIGLVAGYFGGWVDYALSRVIDVVLCFPSTLFFVAFIPIVTTRFVAPNQQTPTWLIATLLILVLSAFGWPTTARLLRGQTLSLRDREFVQAARVMGVHPMRVLLRELLPNLWTPILISASLNVPAYVTTEAALSYLGAGMIEPTPDWGRMIHRGAEVYNADFTYMLFPGLAMLIFVLAFNLLGDSVRDALDPKSNR